MAKKKTHQGGQLAANPRRGNIAEGIAIQLFRPFAAVAPVPREEDHGIDFIGTLLKRKGRCLIASGSFGVQIKTHTAATFSFAGDGISWLRGMKIPYFPVVMNLESSTIQLFTLNKYHFSLHASPFDRYDFCAINDFTEWDRPGNFPLYEPIMQWSIHDCSHELFSDWAFSILERVVAIESNNFRYGPMWRFVRISGGPYTFNETLLSDADLPAEGDVMEVAPGNGAEIENALRQTIGPFVNHVSNRIFADDRSQDILQLRESFRRLGFDPDPDHRWDEIAAEMVEYTKTENATDQCDETKS